MIWAIKNEVLGAYIAIVENEITHVLNDMPLLFDTYREACQYLAKIGNPNDEYAVVAYLP
jgi:hypothetical protein